MHTKIQIEINGELHDVHHVNRNGAEIKALVDEEHGALYRLEGDERYLIGNDEVVHLHEHERFVIVHEHVAITVEVDGSDYLFHHHEHTGAEIKHHAHRPAGNTLYRVESGQRIKITDDETVRLHEGEIFITMPPIGQAS
jgi:hypothetical protein